MAFVTPFLRLVTVRRMHGLRLAEASIGTRSHSGPSVAPAAPLL